MPSDHKGRPIGNPNTSHGGHKPTPLERWKKEQQKEKEEEWRSEAMQFGGTSTNSDSLEDTTYNHADPRNR